MSRAPARPVSLPACGCAMTAMAIASLWMEHHAGHYPTLHPICNGLALPPLSSIGLRGQPVTLSLPSVTVWPSHPSLLYPGPPGSTQLPLPPPPSPHPTSLAPPLLSSIELQGHLARPPPPPPPPILPPPPPLRSEPQHHSRRSIDVRGGGVRRGVAQSNDVF